MLDLMKLETFRTVASTRSFTRAGAQLGYSQSTVTAHIQSLEREVGASLFKRVRFSKEITLTEMGHRTLEYASRLLALAQETSIAIHCQSEPGGQLRVCVHPLLLAYRLSTVLRQYQIQFPHVRLLISAFSDPRILGDSVANGTADVAFILDETIDTDRFISQSLTREKLVIVCSPDHRLTEFAEGVTIRELAQNQVLFSDTNCSIRMMFERTLMLAGTRMDNTVEAGSVEAVKHCAMAGLGFGVLPLFAVEAEVRNRELLVVPVVDAEMIVDMQMIRHAHGWVSPTLGTLLAQFKPQKVMPSDGYGTCSGTGPCHNGGVKLAFH